MSYQLTRSDLQRLRLFSQGLLARRQTSPEALVAALGAIQAQEKASALLAVQARLAGVTEAGLVSALEQERTLVRTWCLRGTLHLVAADDVGWLLPLVAPRVLRNSRRRYRQLELDEQTLDKATALLMEALAESGPLSRAELAAGLEAEGVSAEGQRLPHLLRRAALLGLICHGPERAGEETYVPLDEWLAGRPPTPEKGWEHLAGRYLAAYGPASVDDFARWSGALKGEARAAFAAQRESLAKVGGEEEALWVTAGMAEKLLPGASLPEPPVRLLPAYDPLLLGYGSRDWLVHGSFARAIHPGGGLLRPTLVAGGEAAGTWRLRRRGGALGVEVTPFIALDGGQRRALQGEAETVGNFYGMGTTLAIMPAA